MLLERLLPRNFRGEEKGRSPAAAQHRLPAPHLARPSLLGSLQPEPPPAEGDASPLDRARHALCPPLPTRRISADTRRPATRPPGVSLKHSRPPARPLGAEGSPSDSGAEGWDPWLRRQPPWQHCPERFSAARVSPAASPALLQHEPTVPPARPPARPPPLSAPGQGRAAPHATRCPLRLTPKFGEVLSPSRGDGQRSAAPARLADPYLPRLPPIAVEGFPSTLAPASPLPPRLRPSPPGPEWRGSRAAAPEETRGSAEKVCASRRREKKTLLRATSGGLGGASAIAGGGNASGTGRRLASVGSGRRSSSHFLFLPSRLLRRHWQAPPMWGESPLAAGEAPRERPENPPRPA